MGGDAPPGHGGVGTGEFGLGPSAARAGAAEQEGGDSGGFRGELEAAGGGEADAAGDLGGDAGQAAVAEAVLHDQQRVVPAGLGIDHAIRMEACGGEAGGEQVGLLEHPEDLALDAGEDAGDEHGGGSPVLDVRATAGDLVQGTHREAAARQSGVEIGHAERQRWPFGRRCAVPLQARHHVAQIGEADGRLRIGANGMHGLVLILF